MQEYNNDNVVDDTVYTPLTLIGNVIGCVVGSIAVIIIIAVIVVSALNNSTKLRHRGVVMATIASNVASVSLPTATPGNPYEAPPAYTEHVASQHVGYPGPLGAYSPTQMPHSSPPPAYDTVVNEMKNFSEKRVEGAVPE